MTGLIPAHLCSMLRACLVMFCSSSSAYISVHFLALRKGHAPVQATAHLTLDD